MTAVRNGTVIHVDGPMASVRVEQTDGCARCGATIWCQSERGEVTTISVQNNLNAQVGQKVLISEKYDSFVKISVLQYGIPLVGFVLGIVVVSAGGFTIETLPEELCMFLGGILGLLIGGILSYFWAKRIARQGEHYCEIREIIG